VLTWFFVFVMYLPAWVVLGEWIVLQFLQGGQMLAMAAKRDVGGVAFWAHVGGFLAGLIMIKLFPERKQRYPYATRRIEY
jgi:membrane associated rhomboid family serine protease